MVKGEGLSDVLILMVTSELGPMGLLAPALFHLNHVGVVAQPFQDRARTLPGRVKFVPTGLGFGSVPNFCSYFQGVAPVFSHFRR